MGTRVRKRLGHHHHHQKIIRLYYQHYSGIHTAVGNSKTLYKAFLPLGCVHKVYDLPRFLEYVDFTEDLIRKCLGHDVAETMSVKQGLPSETSSCSAGQEVLWNPKVRYCVLMISDVS
jgi:hypothetical protein